jgi:hypothetical protein
MMDSRFVHNDHGGITIFIQPTWFGWYVLQAIEELLIICFTTIIIFIFTNQLIVFQPTTTIFGTWLPTMFGSCSKIPHDLKLNPQHLLGFRA